MLKLNNADSRPAPFLKWVGGKRQLIGDINKTKPNNMARLIEPFVGGGAVLFSTPESVPAIINDINPELINAYRVVRDMPDALISMLSQHEHGKEYYLFMRSLDRSPGLSELSSVERASRFIFLNRNGFNGLYRENSQGFMNVSYGYPKKRVTYNEDNLLRASQRLQSVTILNESYSDTLLLAEKGDWVYLDPPYIPLSDSSKFTRYCAGDFLMDEQLSLRENCLALRGRGVDFTQSNSSSPITLDLYRDFTVTRVKAKRMVNSKASKRGYIKEVIITK